MEYMTNVPMFMDQFLDELEAAADMESAKGMSAHYRQQALLRKMRFFASKQRFRQREMELYLKTGGRSTP